MWDSLQPDLESTPSPIAQSPIVELRAAKIPGIGWLAIHYWYAVIQDHQRTRWEVWQTPSLAHESWGHLHKNLLPLDAGVGNGVSWVAAQWTGDLAQTLIQVLEDSPITYPHQHTYRYFPGPNSNTYAQWVLDRANNPFRLSWKGIGRNYGQNRLRTGVVDTTG